MSVPWSPELARILALPRRTLTLPPPHVVEAVSAHHRHPGTSVLLRPIQVAALLEFQAAGGLFAPIRVGGGKTLISALLPTMVGAQRPVLFVPAALVAKTRREIYEYSRYWKTAQNLYIQSYQAMGRANFAKWLNQHRPDFIICDEAHRVKNPDAAVTRRLKRYIEGEHEGRRPWFAALSGTLLKNGLLDICHILRWTHGATSPIPVRSDVALEWSVALGFDSARAGGIPPEIGALSALAGAPMGEHVHPEVARDAFRRRLTETLGVVATGTDDASGVPLTLTVRDLSPDINPVSAKWIKKLDTEGETPDEWVLENPMELWKVRRELALGFHYVWAPRPPDAWRYSRKAWGKVVREILSGSRTLDSELEVKRAVLGGHPVHKVWRPILETWLLHEPSFTPNVEPRWHSLSVIERVAEWVQRNRGLIWVEHGAFASALAARLGVPYYGEKGRDASGRYVEEDPARTSIIVGVDANKEGRNLQHRWNANLFPGPLGDGADVWEQTLGRTSREGQRFPVNAEIWLLSEQHRADFTKAISLAHKVYTATGNTQKLLTCEMTGFPRQEIIDALIDQSE